MAVYVDDPDWPLGRMRMCHMVADDPEELVEMAMKLGLRLDWIQKRGRPDEHFDVSKGKRARAVRLGAVEVTSQELVEIIRRKRRNHGSA